MSDIPVLSDELEEGLMNLRCEVTDAEEKLQEAKDNLSDFVRNIYVTLGKIVVIGSVPFNVMCRNDTYFLKTKSK